VAAEAVYFKCGVGLSTKVRVIERSIRLSMCQYTARSSPFAKYSVDLRLCDECLAFSSHFGRGGSGVPAFGASAAEHMSWHSISKLCRDTS
jgi:hypothetical protein